MSLQDHTRGTDQGPGLRPEKTTAPNQFLQLRLLGLRQGLRIRIAGKKGGRDLVHTLVGTLGGEDGAHKELPG
jgi:hypothetical protein